MSLITKSVIPAWMLESSATDGIAMVSTTLSSINGHPCRLNGVYDNVKWDK